MIVPGEGPAPARVMIVAEAPGEQEERSGKPFVGKAGKELNRGLELAGLDRREVYITNVVKERPKHNKTPTDEMLAYWRPALEQELAEVQPEVIVLAGGVAARAFGLTLPMEALHGIPRGDARRRDNANVALARVALEGRPGLHPEPSVRGVAAVEGKPTLYPVYHPAAPLHDTALQTAFYRDWCGLRRLLAGTLPVWQEAPPPVVTLATDADIANLQGLPLIAVDTEGSITQPWGLSFATIPERGYVIPAGSPLLPLFNAAIQDKTVVLHYALHDLPILAVLGIRPMFVRDTLRLARAISETGGLKPLAYRLLGRVLREYTDVAGPLEDEHYRLAAATAADALGEPPARTMTRSQKKAGAGVGSPIPPPDQTARTQHVALLRGYMGVVASAAPKKAWKTRKYLPPAPPWTPPLEGPFLQYAGEDACATVGILPTLHKLTENQREYEQLDRDILPMVERMQEVGLPVDRRYLEDLIPVLVGNKETLRQEMIEITGMGEDFNPASGPQVKAVLFGLMGLTPKKYSKLTGSPTADEKFLRPLKDEFPRLLLQYRELDKQQGTYVEPWLAFLSPDGYLRARLDIGAKTGRMTASDPNVLAIPKHGDMGKVFRRAIRTARPGCVIASWDLSQIELRVLAEMSKDPALCQAFRERIDIHSLTASRIWRLPIDKLQPQHRLPAKCFHPDTEVLTREGWKRITALRAGEEVMQAIPREHGEVSLEWAYPLEVFTAVHPSGQMVHLRNEGMNLRVTPDHRMLGWRQSGSQFVGPPDQFATRVRRWANAGHFWNAYWNVEDHPIARLRLAVALQADGTIDEWGGLRWGFVRQRKIERLRSLLREAQIPFHEAIHRNGDNPPTTAFRVKAEDARRISRLLDENKTFPWWWLGLSVEARNAVLDESEHWDGTRACHRVIVSSVVEKNLDVLQALAAMTGRKSRKQGVRLSIGSHATSRSGNLAVETQPYEGEVACLSVPSTFVLVRDGGVPVICGQTTNFGIVMGIAAQGLLDQMDANGITGWDVPSCDRMIQDWLAAYPKAAAWFQLNQAEAREQGYVVGWGGKVFWLGGIWSTDKRVVSEAERQATALKVQGGAQYLIKRAMRRLWQDFLPGLKQQGYIECLLQIHDELVFEMDEALIPAADAALQECLCRTTPLSVPVESKGAYGRVWEGADWREL